jgi:hypothetical protein
MGFAGWLIQEHQASHSRLNDKRVAGRKFHENSLRPSSYRDNNLTADSQIDILERRLNQHRPAFTRTGTHRDNLSPLNGRTNAANHCLNLWKLWHGWVYSWFEN